VTKMSGLSTAGLRQGLAEMGEARKKLRARLAACEREADAAEGEAEALRKLGVWLDVLEEAYRQCVADREEKASET
jgi:hypothetical protein